MSLYEDGVYAGRPQQFGAPFFDVERVEVLRGPQGALFGKNTAAGAISIITANPTQTFMGSMTGSYNFSLRGTELNGFVSGPLSNSVGARLAVRVRWRHCRTQGRGKHASHPGRGACVAGHTIGDGLSL